MEMPIVFLVVWGFCFGVSLAVVPYMILVIFAQRKAIKALNKVMTPEQKLAALEVIEDES